MQNYKVKNERIIDALAKKIINFVGIDEGKESFVKFIKVLIDGYCTQYNYFDKYKVEEIFDLLECESIDPECKETLESEITEILLTQVLYNRLNGLKDIIPVEWKLVLYKEFELIDLVKYIKRIYDLNIKGEDIIKFLYLTIQRLPRIRIEKVNKNMLNSISVFVETSLKSIAIEKLKKGEFGKIDKELIEYIDTEKLVEKMKFMGYQEFKDKFGKVLMTIVENSSLK